MAIITFCSNETKETGQTLSMAAIATYMAIEHNYKVLMISTNFNDLSLENCFWEIDKIRPNTNVAKDGKQVGIESGVEGLMKIITSNKTTPEIIRNYSKIVLRDRLDVLIAPNATSYAEYVKITPMYTNIIQIANRYYDLVFIDLSKKMPKTDANNIMQISDVVILNLTQRLKTIDTFMELRDSNEFYRRSNVMLAIGRYDRFSKYNNKNITRYLKEKKPLSVIPYNTLYFEACSEGKIVDFFLKLKSINDESDRNAAFIKEITNIDNAIIYKLQELQMKI